MITTNLRIEIRKMRKLVFVLILSTQVFVFSQETANEDIKVGVVLSGGGAKGLAHIGALKVIEDAGIRIDYIGGTSMGAIVGGLYASGYNAKQLDSIFRTIDFETLIQDEVPRSAKTFFEKDDAERYALTLPFDDFKVAIPSGISKGQNVYNLLSRLLIHVKDVNDFSELPIPFFCVATNIETGEEIILNRGYLPRAVSASAALPTLFSPVTINDTIYIDGGVVNNYPVDEVRAMGADIMIGVDVQHDLWNRDKLKSAVDVMLQINNYRTMNAMVEKKKRTDIYIHPQIDEFSVVSFADERQIVKAGETASTELLPALQKIAQRQKKAIRDKIQLNPVKSFYIKDVGIEGNKNYSRAYVLGKLKLRTPAEISYQEFNEGVNNLSATGNFDGIDYRDYVSLFIGDPIRRIWRYVNFCIFECKTKKLHSFFNKCQN